MIIDDVRSVLGRALQLGSRTGSMGPATPLLGAIPELDSMAVITLITAIEERFAIAVEDDEINAATFETLGSLSAYVESKMNG